MKSITIAVEFDQPLGTYDTVTVDTVSSHFPLCGFLRVTEKLSYSG